MHSNPMFIRTKDISVAEFINTDQRKEIAEQIEKLAKEYVNDMNKVPVVEPFNLRKSLTKSPKGSRAISRSPPPMDKRLEKIEQLQDVLIQLGVPHYVGVEIARKIIIPNTSPYQMSY